MTEDERGRVGRLLKGLREDQGLNQAEIATKTGLSVGTVQAIEYKKYRVHDTNIEKYAAAVGTTTHKLLHPDAAIRLSDPLLVDLNREHLVIARRYMRAVKAVRTAVEVLLDDVAELAEITEEIADVVLALRNAVERKPQIVYWVWLLLERDDLLSELAHRLDRDPRFEERLRGALDDPTPPPALTPTEGAPRSKRKMK